MPSIALNHPSFSENACILQTIREEEIIRRDGSYTRVYSLFVHSIFSCVLISINIDSCRNNSETHAQLMTIHVYYSYGDQIYTRYGNPLMFPSYNFKKIWFMCRSNMPHYCNRTLFNCHLQTQYRVRLRYSFEMYINSFRLIVRKWCYA